MSEIRDQIAAVLGQRLPCLKCSRTVACRCYVKDAQPYHERQADALMIVVQPVLDQRDAEIERLNESVLTAYREVRAEKKRAETAEADLEKLREIGRIFMGKVDATRTALNELDAAIDRPADWARLRACFNALVRTLDLPEEMR